MLAKVSPGGIARSEKEEALLVSLRLGGWALLRRAPCLFQLTETAAFRHLCEVAISDEP